MKVMGGSTEMWTRRQLNEQFGLEDKTVDVDVPEDGEHIWEWFWHLSGMRASGMNGPQPLNYLDLEAWKSATGTIVLREEIEILLRMDRAYLNAISDEQEAQRTAENEQRRTPRP